MLPDEVFELDAKLDDLKAKQSPGRGYDSWEIGISSDII
jgi:hypothetical protein